MSAYARRRSVAKATGFPDEVAQVDDQLGTVHQVGPVQRQATGQLLGLGEQLQRRALLELRVLVDVRQLAVVGQQGAGLRVREIHTESERSEELRLGNERVSTCQTRGVPSQ